MKNKFGVYTAISIVVANMIGTGIFTSLGFQVQALNSGFALLFLWLLGGIAATTGALAYAELGTRFPRSGGEYHFLSVTYHPSLGFMAGWISFIVGFAAPTAAAAIALGAYLRAALELKPALLGIQSEKYIATVIIILLTILHSSNKKAGAHFQSIFSSLKILIIGILIILGLSSHQDQNLSFTFNYDAFQEILSPAFVISLFFVSFSYSGWNSAAYIAGELKKPGKNIPISLITGTLIVTTLYILVTYAFLKIIPINSMAGKIEIGFLFGSQIFSNSAAVVMGLLFSLLLLSTVSALIITGPRVTQVMGEDYNLLKWFGKKSTGEIPVRAILVQSLLSLIYIITSTFEQVITYIGFTLNLFTLMTVIGLIIIRYKEPKPAGIFSTPLYPILPLLFVLISTWILVYGIIYKPVESTAGIATALAGLIFYYWDKRRA